MEQYRSCGNDSETNKFKMKNQAEDVVRIRIVHVLNANHEIQTFLLCRLMFVSS